MFRRQERDHLNVLDSQQNIIVITNGTSLIDANQRLYEFFTDTKNLESFREKGVQIEEVKSSNKKYKNEDSLKYFLENSKVEVFKDIKDPVAWQNSIRNEWK